MGKKLVTIDGNEAAANVAYRLSEVIAIYPITPSSNMGEHADFWAANNIPNLWGIVPSVTEMQSEGGAAGAIHGALQAGALGTTFTASQGLLLMIPNMYKIAGELNSTVFHISARTVASHALSIFGDHSDVMACRQTGWAMLASGSIQEIMDNACIAHAATLESRVPFLHFFDGFRSSHEIQKIEQLSDEDLKAMINEEMVIAHRKRALTPDNPFIRGTAQNPDVFFQARESCNPFYEKVPSIVQKVMERFYKITGRRYRLFDYFGHPEAERVIILMGSGAEAVHETVDYLIKTNQEKVGVIKVRLYRPFSFTHLLEVMPKSVRKIAILDRTKEPGALGEPLFTDIATGFFEAKENGTWVQSPILVGGRYGLSSKEFNSAMVKGIFDELKKEKPKKRFTIGIEDDVSHLSLNYDPSFSAEDPNTFKGVFIGFGSDGTVTGTKNSIKIISELTDNFVQAYFVYDSKKSGSMTESHLRFSKNPIRSTYLINKANFIACHKWEFLESLNVLRRADNGATFLLNSPYGPDEVWDKIPVHIQTEIVNKKLKLYVIDAYKIAKETGLDIRINTIMQVCFFALTNIISQNVAIEEIKKAVQKTFGRKGEDIVKMNMAAIDMSLSNLAEVKVPATVTSKIPRKKPVSDKAPDFVKNVTSEMMIYEGDNIPVSKLPSDGTFISSTTRWEKRYVSSVAPIWYPEICTQCGKCSLICPHAVIRMKTYDKSYLEKAPATLKSIRAIGKEFPEGTMFTLQVSLADCTGCGLCIEICPAKNKASNNEKALKMADVISRREEEQKNWDFFESIPYRDRASIQVKTVKGSQFLEPLFEFSGACAGCGETPYLKLLSQLFGDRLLIANATGCSSIYGGNLPTTPWAKNRDGRGPAWSNSLFEDCAEFGAGFRLSINKKIDQAKIYLNKLRSKLGDTLVDSILNAQQIDEATIIEQRKRVEELKSKLTNLSGEEVFNLTSLVDYLVKKSVWSIGGDGWAYDIGYGGLDHVLASGLNVNLLVLDTEVYSNTGGQMSKASPIGAVTKFAANGKETAKKDLGLMAISYGTVYVAKVSLHANEVQTIRAFLEAESYDGPSMIVAYCPCIAHGYDLKNSIKQAKLAVDCGYWPLYRYNPTLSQKGENPLKLDSKPPKVGLEEYIYNEIRYKMLKKSNPERAEFLLKKAQDEIKRVWNFYTKLAEGNVRG